ncbi:hypothetical protein GOODEAATRI_019074 [Goodea atripinnis]|uniref:Uncharacterized protein n=1 Tax=Goodea atripinnis TaxID=208336 RepID=A0ABV0P640_9TELE
MKIQLQCIDNPSIFYTCFFCRELRGSWCLSPAVYGEEVGYTLDRSPVHHRATQRHTGQIAMHTKVCMVGPSRCKATVLCVASVRTPTLSVWRSGGPVAPIIWQAHFCQSTK